jgi:Domain of unknown function (DUF4158)
LKKAEGRGQRAEGTSQKGIQTPPDLGPLNKSSVGVLNPCSLRRSGRGQEPEFPSAFCLLPSAFPDNRGQELAAIAISNAAEVRDHPADLINVAIEELVRQRYELPAFSTLDRLAGHIRSIVNTRLFKRLARQLSPADRQNLDLLLVPDSSEMTMPNWGNRYSVYSIITGELIYS